MATDHQWASQSEVEVHILQHTAISPKLLSFFSGPVIVLLKLMRAFTSASTNQALRLETDVAFVTP